MRPFRTLILLVLVPSAGIADSGVDNALLAQSRAAVAEIPAQPAGRRLLMLPTLEFEISIAARCEADAHPETISISVADTQTVYEVDGPDGAATLQTTLRIPRRQLSPLATEAFCIEDETNTGARQSLLIRAALTAHVSLRCAREEGPSVHFEAIPLDIRLVCDAADNAAAEQPQDGSAGRF